MTARPPGAASSRATGGPRAARPPASAAALLAPALVLAALLGLGAGPVRADGTEPPPAKPGRLFLSWNAPEGSPRAAERVAAPCAEARGMRDTLWISFDPGRDSTDVLGVRAVVVFRAAPGETLSSFWDLGEGTRLERIRIDFEPDSIPDDALLWRHGVSGGGFYDRSASQGSLTIIGAVSASAPARLRGGRPYVFARVIFPRPLRSVGADCAQPVCVHLASASIAYGVGDEPSVPEGRRLAAWNPDGDPCAPWRGAQHPGPWRPGGSLKK